MINGRTGSFQARLVVLYLSATFTPFISREGLEVRKFKHHKLSFNCFFVALKVPYVRECHDKHIACGWQAGWMPVRWLQTNILIPVGSSSDLNDCYSFHWRSLCDLSCFFTTHVPQPVWLVLFRFLKRKHIMPITQLQPYKIQGVDTNLASNNHPLHVKWDQACRRNMVPRVDACMEGVLFRRCQRLTLQSKWSKR